MATKLIQYTSLKDSLDDSAYGLFQSEEFECYILVGIGPGFDPWNRNNKGGHAWGNGIFDCNAEVIPANLSEHMDAEEIGGGEYIGPFLQEDFEDHDKVKKMMQHIAEQLLQDEG